MISLCESAAEKSSNTVVLNQSTDTISCEVEYNLDMIFVVIYRVNMIILPSLIPTTMLRIKDTSTLVACLQPQLVIMYLIHSY